MIFLNISDSFKSRSQNQTIIPSSQVANKPSETQQKASLTDKPPQPANKPDRYESDFVSEPLNPQVGVVYPRARPASHR